MSRIREFKQTILHGQTKASSLASVTWDSSSTSSLESWRGYQVSNLDRHSQSVLCYRYTIPLQLAGEQGIEPCHLISKTSICSNRFLPNKFLCRRDSHPQYVRYVKSNLPNDMCFLHTNDDTFWRPRMESNHHLHVRSVVSCPLKDRGILNL